MSNNKKSNDHIPDVGKKVSSVEWLFSEMYNIISFYAGNEQDALCERIKQQTKATHKEEIIKSMSFAFIDGAKIGAIEYESPYTDWEQYYNETFNNNGNTNGN